MIYIYALIDPINDNVFYIGATMNPKSRFYHHCSQVFDNKKGNTIINIFNSGHKPEMLILDIVKWQDVELYEDFYTDLFRSFGYDIQKIKSKYIGSLCTYQKKTLDKEWIQYCLTKD